MNAIKFLLAMALLFYSITGIAQDAYITGPDSVVLGDGVTYYVHVPDAHGDVLTSQWYANSGSCSGCSVSYHLFTATYTFNEIGVKEIEFEYRAENYDDLVWKDVVVYDPPEAPPTPDTPVIQSNCVNATLVRNEPPAGVTWYWHTNDLSNKTTDSGVTYLVSQSGYYYLRARDNTTGTWSNYSSKLWVTLNPLPDMASGNDKERCLTGTVTLEANPGNGGNTIRWYDSPTGGALLFTGLQYQTEVLTASQTFYVATYNATWNCEASSRKAITAIVNNSLPGIAGPTDEWICAASGQVELNADPGDDANNLYWYDVPAGGTAIHLGTSYTTPVLSQTKTYYVSSVRTTSEGCESERVSIVAGINAVPEVSAGNDREVCTNSIIELGGNPVGGNWRGTGVSNNIFEAANAGEGEHELVYTYTEYYDVGFCYNSDTVIFAVILETPVKPQYPSVFKNYWSEWKLVKSQAPSNEIWYWQGTDAAGTDPSDSGSVYIANTTSQYYLRALNTNTACWSDPTEIDVQIASDNGYNNLNMNEPLGNN